MKTLIKSKSFSIVEVIVVCAVVAILSSLIMSASSSVREAGRKTTCLNNLKQIQAIYEAYRKDHRKAPAGDILLLNDFTFASEYISESDLETFICPGDESNELLARGIDGLDGYTSYSYVPIDHLSNGLVTSGNELASSEEVQLASMKLVAFDKDDGNHHGNRNIVYFHGSGNSKSGIAQTLKRGTFSDLALLDTPDNASEADDNASSEEEEADDNASNEQEEADDNASNEE